MLGMAFVPEGRLSSGVKESGSDERYLFVSICSYDWALVCMFCSQVFSPFLRTHDTPSQGRSRSITCQSYIISPNMVATIICPDTSLISVEEQKDLAPERWTWILALPSTNKVTFLHPPVPHLQSRNYRRISHNSYHLSYIYITTTAA